jgi:hypothetical protein
VRASEIELHIEELVLDGFAHADRYRIGDTFERELSRLLSEQGVPSALVADGLQTHLDAGACRIAAGSTAEHIGAQLAQAVYGGLKG